MKIEELEKAVRKNIKDLQEDSKETECAFIVMTDHGAHNGEHIGLFAASGSNEQLINMAVNLLHMECKDLQDDGARKIIEEMLIRAAMEDIEGKRESGDEHEEESHGIYS